LTQHSYVFYRTMISKFNSHSCGRSHSEDVTVLSSDVCLLVNKVTLEPFEISWSLCQTWLSRHLYFLTSGHSDLGPDRQSAQTPKITMTT